MRWILIFMLLLWSRPDYGQETENMQRQVDISSLTIRPNSRDYLPAFKNNEHARLEHRQAIALSNRIRLGMRANPDFMKRQQMIQKKSRAVMRKHMQQQKQFRKKQMMRRQMIRQRMIKEKNRPDRR